MLRSGADKFRMAIAFAMSMLAVFNLWRMGDPSTLTLILTFPLAIIGVVGMALIMFVGIGIGFGVYGNPPLSNLRGDSVVLPNKTDKRVVRYL